MKLPSASFLFSLLLLSLPLSSFAKSKRQKADAQWKSRKRDCERSPDLCGSLIPEEAGNCVAKCTSEDCWKEVYEDDEIEDGEIDPERQRVFMACTRRVYRENKKKSDRKKAEERRKGKGGRGGEGGDEEGGEEGGGGLGEEGEGKEEKEMGEGGGGGEKTNRDDREP